MDEHDRYMNELALRVSKVLSGSSYFDTACVSGLMIAYALNEGFVTVKERAEAWELIKAFIEEHMNSGKGLKNAN